VFVTTTKGAGTMKRTKYAQEMMATQPDEERVVTLDEIKSRKGILWTIAAAMLARHGCYGYTVADTGRTVRLVLAR
jgi:hypothetical protein